MLSFSRGAEMADEQFVAFFFGVMLVSGTGFFAAPFHIYVGFN